MKIIAECAINWNTLEEAKEMIRECKRLGLFAAKFQLFREENIVNPEHREYCLERMLDFEKAKELFEYGKSIGQEVFFTCMFTEAVDWCRKLDVKYYKIRYIDRNNEDLLKRIGYILKKENSKTTKFKGDYRIFVSLSEGDLDWDHIDHKKETYFDDIMGYAQTEYLYCIPKYPATLKEYLSFDHLLQGQHSWGEYKTSGFDGISDHTSNLCLLQMALYHSELEYFEKHVCLTRENCLEAEWAVTFEELEEVLKNG